MWATVTKCSMKQALIIRSSKSSTKHSCLADLGVIWEKCGMEKGIIIIEIGVLPSLGEHYLSLILYGILETLAVFSAGKRLRKREKRDIGKLELIDKFIIMNETSRNCEIPLYIYIYIWKNFPISPLQYFRFILHHQMARLLVTSSRCRSVNR